MKCEHNRFKFSTASVEEDGKLYEAGFFWCLDCKWITRELESPMTDAEIEKAAQWVEANFKERK